VSGISTILWDIGGVLLTNGWDKPSRILAAEKFGLDWDEFESRHQQLEPLWDRDLIRIDEYLKQAIFHRTRPFTAAEFKEFMLGCTQPHPGTIAFAGDVYRSRRYLQAALNNEPLDLNLYRIEQYGLRSCFTAFFSSCFLGVAKPDPEIYRKTLMILQRPAEECLFIDDRETNLESARTEGMRTLLYSGLSQLRESLRNIGVFP
jgi:putative hydrolase of the HAD superfamily